MWRIDWMVTDERMFFKDLDPWHPLYHNTKNRVLKYKRFGNALRKVKREKPTCRPTTVFSIINLETGQRMIL